MGTDVPRRVRGQRLPMIPAEKGYTALQPVPCLIFVVLVTHNRPVLLKEALQALAAQTLAPHSVVVVDNASDMATAQVLAASPIKVDVVRSEINLGGAGGFALGMQRAIDRNVDWMFLIDDDAIAHPEALAELKAQMLLAPANAGAVCSRVIEFGAVALQHRRNFDAHVGVERPLRLSRYSESCVRMDTGSFVGFMVSAHAVRTVGLPNADFFLSYDDTEYSLRLGHHDFTLWLVPSSVIVHKRTEAGRLRSTEFGAKHYYNVRNRIAVKRSYCRSPGIAAALGAFFGLALWLRTPDRFACGSWRVLISAVADGVAGRLGPFPQNLQRRGTP